MADVIGGVLPVAHTPFDEHDQIDWSSLQRQIDWAFERGADGFCTGMVSELLRLTTHERLLLTERLAELNAGRGLFVASVGAESTRCAIELARHATSVGCDAIMAIPPISTRLPDEPLVAYFSQLAESVSVPVIVQDASGYVGQTISSAVYGELLQRFGTERIWFKPEAAPVGPVISRLLLATDGAARVFDGSGGSLLIDAFRRGAVGTIPGMEFLDAVVSLWRALRAGEEDLAYHIYFPLCALVTLQLQAGLDGFLAIEKYILHKRGLFRTARRREPYTWSLDDPTREEVDRLLDMLERALSMVSQPPTE